MEVIAWIGFSQALFSGLLIGTKRGRSAADNLLSAWLILMAIEFGTYGVDLRVFGPTPLLSNPFLLFNPAMYLYTLSLTRKKFVLRPAQLLHLLPYIAFEGGAYLLGERRELGYFFDNDSTLWFLILFAIAAFASWIVYPWLSYAAVHRRRMTLENEFSTLDSFKRLSWVVFVLAFTTAYWVVSLVLGMYNVFSGREAMVWTFHYSTLLALTYILGFYGLKQGRIDPAGAEEDPEKYRHSRLRADYKQRILQRLLDLFETEKPYLDSELTVHAVAAKLKITRHALTETLNSALGKNFYQFVNEYRVEAVKKMLLSPRHKHLSIEAVGYECGFNSKSAFFSVFRKMTGATPAAYQAQKKEQHVK
jgi:AraC-like DNA-binding protein